MKSTNRLEAIGGEVPTNGAAVLLAMTEPYTARIEITGTADILFHRWNVEAVEAAAGGRKGSAVKKTDNVESYVWRCENGNMGVPGEYLRMSMINAAKYRQDPRSPRKSMMDMAKAAIISLTPIADTKLKNWEYTDRRRVVIGRAGITRSRPAMKVGWKLTFDMMCMLPEYIEPMALHDLASVAGKLVGIGDFRPTYGRFNVTRFEVLTEK